MRAFAAVVAALLAGSSAASAQRLSLAPELSVGAGYDDNLFLDPSLTGAAPPRADAVIDFRPSLLAALVHHGHALSLDVDYLERVTPSNGDLRFLALRLEWRTPVWHRLQLAVAPVYEYYEATEFTDNTFDLGGGEAALRLALGRVALQAGYRADARGYSDPSRNGQLDFDQQASLTARAVLHERVALEVGYRFFNVASNEPTAALDRHRGEVALSIRPWSSLFATAGYAIWFQSLPNGAPPLPSSQPGGPRQDVAHGLWVAASARPLRWLELFARYQLIVSTSDQPNGRYQLDEVVAGAAVGWTFAHERVPPPAPLLPTVHAGEVTFRARARPGARVGVVGDWNGWQPQPLAATGGDRYEATLRLPPGRHAWALSIDGRLATPPEASAFADDGFGGRNAIVDVP